MKKCMAQSMKRIAIRGNRSPEAGDRLTHSHRDNTQGIDTMARHFF